MRISDIPETCVQSLGWEDPLEEGMGAHFSILAWRIPMDRGAWWVTLHSVTKSWTQLSDKAQHSTDHSPRGTDLGDMSFIEAESHSSSSLKILALAKAFSSLLFPPKEGKATTEEFNQGPADLVKDHILTTCSPTTLKN